MFGSLLASAPDVDVSGGIDDDDVPSCSSTRVHPRGMPLEDCWVEAGASDGPFADEAVLPAELA